MNILTKITIIMGKLEKSSDQVSENERIVSHSKDINSEIYYLKTKINK